MLKLRDPFRRPDIQGAELVKKTELETFPVDQLKMLAVATGPKHLKAAVLAPNGNTYFLSVGTKVGLRKGVVTQITVETVKIKEKVVNVLGQEEDVESVLHLPSEYKNSNVAGFVGSAHDL
jgi:Tfp pilus assembly protein PilP